LSITFQHPYTTPTLTLTLRNPELGDSEGLDIKTQFQITMDGSVYSHRRTPENKTLVLAFKNITKAIAAELFDFVLASAGEEVKYTDYHAVIWRGYIVSDPVETATETKIINGTCVEVKTFVLQFKGAVI